MITNDYHKVLLLLDLHLGFIRQKCSNKVKTTFLTDLFNLALNEPRYEKTGSLPMRKQKRKSDVQ